MPFPESVVIEVLVRCARHCCICRKFCGTRMQLHHIKQEAHGGTNTIDNCIPLCLDCHEEVGSYNPLHPIGRKFSENELKQHRDLWFDFVATHPERLNSSGTQFWRPHIEAKNDSEIQGWVEPHYHEATIVRRGSLKHEQKEIFGAKVRNKGQRALFVDEIGFTVEEKRYPGLFGPYSSKDGDSAFEVLPGHSQVFNFFELKILQEEIKRIDGMYLTAGSGHTFVNRTDSLQRLIQDFVKGGTAPGYCVLVYEEIRRS